MPSVDIYGMTPSAPCRIVMMTCDILGVQYNFHNVDLQKGENKTPEYLKMNPQHNIPTLKDGDFIMNESRAAAAYLAAKYGKDDSLYPKDVKVRAVIDQRLYFDMGTFYKAFGDCVYPLMFKSGKPGEKEHDRFKEVMGWVNDFIKPTGYVAGTKHLTLADVAFVSTYGTIVATEHFDLSQWPETQAWYARVKGEIKNYEKANGEGAGAFGGWFKMMNQ